MNNQKSIINSAFWFSISFIFGLYLCAVYGAGDSLKYFGCYFIENALSLDNLFMFYIIFTYFKFNQDQQQKALWIGLITAAVFRFLFIFCGSEIIKYFSIVNYAIGIFLIYSGVKFFLSKKDNEESEPKKIISFVNKYIKFLTPMGIVIVVIEITDILFAFDSVPASFGITNNPWIIYFANIFAILGLRSIYFFILNKLDKFESLQKYIAVILSVIGIKMLIF